MSMTTYTKGKAGKALFTLGSLGLSLCLLMPRVDVLIWPSLVSVSLMCVGVFFEFAGREEEQGSSVPLQIFPQKTLNPKELRRQ
jgi:hypothetical protein